MRLVTFALMTAAIIAGSGCTKSARSHRAQEAGGRYFAEEKYDNAEVEYRKAFALDRQNAIAIEQLGRIYVKEGRLMEAGVYLAEANRRIPTNIDIEIGLAEVAVAFHDTTNAAKLSTHVLNVQPTNETAMLTLVDSGIPVASLRQLVESLPNPTGNPSYHIAKGVMALRQTNFSLAENEMHEALSVNPKSTTAYVVLAQIYALQRNGPAAGKALKSAAENAPERSGIRIKYTDYLIQNGQIDDAHKLLKEMTDKAPDYIPGWVASMNLALAERKFDDAGKFADTILQRDDRNFDGLRGRGTVYLAKGEGEKAVAQFERTETLFKHSEQVKYDMAMAYLMTKDRVKAVAALNQALSINPNYAQAIMLLAQVQIRAGDAASAVPLLTGLVRKQPTLAQAQLLLADAYVAQQKPESAVAVYRSLAVAIPKNPQIPLLTGVVLMEEGKIAEARTEYEKSLELAPGFPPAMEQMVDLDIAEKNFKHGIAMVQDQITKSPKAAMPWELMAKLDIGQNNSTAAETDLTKAIELDPNLSTPYLLLAQVYIKSSKYQDALTKLKTLLGKTNDAVAYLETGAIHEALKDFPSAKDDYENVLKINSKSIPALNNLAYIYAVHITNIDRAYDLAQQSRQLLPYNPNVADTLGWVLYHRNDFARALPILEEARERAPTDPEIGYHLGMTLYAMGDEAGARSALHRAVSSTQDFAGKDDARAHLAIVDATVGSATPAVIQQMEETLKAHPTDPIILNRLGALQEAAGQTDKAVDTYEKALKVNPGAVHIMSELALIYGTRLNQLDKGVQMAESAHKMSPDDAQVSGVLGRLKFKSGDYTWALSLLENAADRQPNNPTVLHDLAWAYYGVGRITDAQNAMTKSLQLNIPFFDSADAKQFLALTDAYGSAAKFEAALALSKQILKTDGKNVPALMVVAADNERANDFKSAQATYNKALEILPMFVPAARQLAVLDSKHFTDDAAGLAAADKAHPTFPDDNDLNKAIGVLGFYQGSYQHSEDALQTLVAKSTTDGEVYFYLGMDYNALKQSKEAKENLTRALSMKLPDKLATQAKDAMATLK